MDEVCLENFGYFIFELLQARIPQTAPFQMCHYSSFIVLLIWILNQILFYYVEKKLYALSCAI